MSEVTLQNDTSKSVLALLFSLSPIYFLIQSKIKLGLDSLHIGLIQVVLLLLFRVILNFDPRTAFRRKSSVATKREVVVDLDTGVVKQKTKLAPEREQKAAVKRIKSKKSKSKEAPSTNSLFPPALLDATIYKFLSITEPSYAKLVPTPDSSYTENSPPTAALTTWTSLYKADNIEVLQHPKLKMLYAISARFPDVPVRQLFETLANVEERSKWDSTCMGSENIERVDVGGRKGNVAWMGMKGMYPVKAKDLVLLSMAARLPSSPDGASESKEAIGKIRLICASTSFNHPKVPEKKEFNRMILGISGFLCEEDGAGSKIVQITDLSGLGSWIPSAILRTVTQTMIPKSLYKLGKTAALYDIATQSAHPVDGDEWLPPVLGSFDDNKTTASGEDEDHEVDEAERSEEDTESEFEGDEDLSPIQSTSDLRALLVQLRSLTSRLSALESASSRSSNRPWYSFLTTSSDPGAGVEQGQLTMGAKVGLIGGGALGTAAALAVLQVWARRKR